LSPMTNRNDAVHIEVVSGPKQLIDLTADWNRLLSRSRSDSIFLTHEWMSTWWDVFGDDARELLVLVIRRNHEIIGIAPFILTRTRDFGFIAFKRLEFLGTGEAEADEVLTENLDILVEKNNEEVVGTRVWDHLVSPACRWDEAQFVNLLEDGVFYRNLRTQSVLFKNRIHFQRESERYYIKLPDTWEEYLSLLEPNKRKRLLRHRRKMSSRYAWRVRVAANHETIEKDIEELARLHMLRWKLLTRQINIYKSAVI
jgi:CelD/BcsL family acetyltransferase involved in cellulose biosynthesis